MCGIAGIIGQLGDTNRAALKQMNAAMAHRGPDAEGVWESPPDTRGLGMMLGHRRLAILDLSPAGDQPMVDPITNDVIVFNGEIYNYRELRERLIAAGQRFQSTGDTAVMLRALAVQGSEAVAWLRGMFAFAFWSRSERKLVLARDPLGIKPLYLARNPDATGDWSLIFASEVRALLASGLLKKPRLRVEAAPSLVWNGFIVGPNTAVEGIELVGAGSLRVFDSTGHEERSREYWTFPRPVKGEIVEEARLASALEECVRLHLASDVPLAVFLSGGVDSSSVANLAQRASSSEIHTFTLAFEEEEFNEGRISRQIAKAIGTQHHEVSLTEEQFLEDLEAALDSLDQPTFDALNSFYLSKAVRTAGFTVALAGTGGDELFGGYATFRDLPLLLQWSKNLRFLPKALRQAAARLVTLSKQGLSAGVVPPQTRWAKLPGMVERGEDLLSIYQLAYSLFLPEFQDHLLSDGSRAALVDGLPPALRRQLVQEIDSRSPKSAVSLLEHRLFLGERLLRDADAASMASSLEQRLPLVDQVLVQNAEQLPDDLRYSPTGKKALLRRVGLRGLDPALFKQPKRGFLLPFDRWIRLRLGKRIEAAMRDPQAIRPTGLNPEIVGRLWQAFLDNAPGIYWSRVWAIYVFIRWCHRHGVYR